MSNIQDIFDSQAFIEKVAEPFKPFYRIFMETQMFIKFIEDRTFHSEFDHQLVFFDTEMEALHRGAPRKRERPKHMRKNSYANFRKQMIPPLRTSDLKDQEFSYPFFPMDFDETLFSVALVNSITTPDLAKTPPSDALPAMDAALGSMTSLSKDPGTTDSLASPCPVSPKFRRSLPSMSETSIPHLDLMAASPVSSGTFKPSILQNPAHSSQQQPQILVNSRSRDSPNSSAGGTSSDYPSIEINALLKRASTNARRRGLKTALQRMPSLHAPLAGANGAPSGSKAQFFGGVKQASDGFKEMLLATYCCWFKLFGAYAARASRPQYLIRCAFSVLDWVRFEENLTPDLFIYEVLLEVCGRKRLGAESKVIFQEMTTLGVTPNATAYSWIVEAVAGRSGNGGGPMPNTDLDEDGSLGLFDDSMDLSAVEASAGAFCTPCGIHLTELDVLVGWNKEDHTFSSSCPMCGNAVYPALELKLKEQSTFTGVSPQAILIAKQFLDLLDDTSCQLLKPSILLDELVYQLSVLPRGGWTSKLEFARRSPTLFWNLVWAFANLEVPFDLAGLERMVTRSGGALLRPDPLLASISATPDHILRIKSPSLHRQMRHSIEPFFARPDSTHLQLGTSLLLSSGLPLASAYDSSVGMALDPRVSGPLGTHSASTNVTLGSRGPVKSLSVSMRSGYPFSTVVVGRAAVTLNSLRRTIQGSLSRRYPSSGEYFLSLFKSRSADPSTGYIWRRIDSWLPERRLDEALKLFLSARVRYEAQGTFASFYTSCYDALSRSPGTREGYEDERDFREAFRKGVYWLEAGLKELLDARDEPPPEEVTDARMVFRHLRLF
jgi:hypothetical protein